MRCLLDMNTHAQPHTCAELVRDMARPCGLQSLLVTLKLLHVLLIGEGGGAEALLVQGPVVGLVAGLNGVDVLVLDVPVVWLGQ